MIKIAPIAGLYDNYDITPLTTIMVDSPAVIDGDLITPVASYLNQYESFGIDLGDTYTPAYIYFYDNYGEDTGYGGYLDVYYSFDNANWILLGSYSVSAGEITRTSSSPGIWQINMNTSISARYWRLYIPTSSALYAIIGGIPSVIYLTEMEFYISEFDTQLLISDTYILPYTTANPLVFNFNSSETFDFYTPSYREPKLKHTCNHVLSTGTYTLETCPRCVGTGYYFDIKFNPDGQVESIRGSDKLAQELEKITLTPLGENIFHNLYGTTLNNLYTDVIGPDTRQNKLKKSIINAVLRLKLLQSQAITQGAGFDASELIDKIERIDVFELYNDSTAVGFRVYISTLNGEHTTIEGTIIS
jgi:phage baseplate assembly protein W